MSDTKPVVGKVVLSSGSAKPATPPQIVPPLPSTVQLTKEQFAALQHTLILGFVTMGAMANGLRPNTKGRIQEIENLANAVKGLL